MLVTHRRPVIIGTFAMNQGPCEVKTRATKRGETIGGNTSISISNDCNPTPAAVAADGEDVAAEAAWFLHARMKRSRPRTYAKAGMLGVKMRKERIDSSLQSRLRTQNAPDVEPRTKLDRSSRRSVRQIVGNILPISALSDWSLRSLETIDTWQFPRTCSMQFRSEIRTRIRALTETASVEVLKAGTC